jgi:hypothetical protein
MKKSYILIGILIIAIIGVLGYIGIKKINDDSNDSKVESTSFVTISINPEIELGLDEQDKVVEVLPINADADVLTSDLNLVGLTIEEASEEIIDSAMETGYLDEYSDENTIVVTTISDNEEKRKALEEKVITKMNNHFETRKIYPILVAKGLDDDLKAEADSYDISYGKMLLVDYASALNQTLSKDVLVDMSIRDIQGEIKDYIKERHNTLKMSLKEAKEKWQEQKKKLKQDYKNKIEELKSNISEEHKEELKNMTSDQKKEAIKNYLNAKKATIKNDIEAIKNNIKKDIDEYNYPILENNAETIKENIKNRIEERRNKK